LLQSLHEKPSIITLDYSLPDMTGEELLKKIKNQTPQIPVIIISGQEDIKTAVKLLQIGAYDYISKEENLRERLLNSINNAKKSIHLAKEVEMLREELSEKYDFQKTILGTSPVMQEVFKMISKALNNNITVSITGETGTGKEVVAKAIHFNSNRKKKPFVAINIAAIPDSLLESELFGYEKGAFTGATARRIGKFEEANGGTIFIDEIGEMSLPMQTKLLRVLQERELVRIGGNETVKLDVRIITATHKDLAQEVKKGNFREDLYYRLLGLTIKIPPLRERGNDIILLAKHFLDSFAKENGMGKLILTKEAQAKLLKYTFPGNVRELKAIIELAAVICTNNQIKSEDIQFKSITKNISETLFEKELTMKDYVLLIVKHFLDKYDQNVMLVAQKLDIGKSTIYRYLQEMNSNVKN
ncbi:MAG: sigma-54 dependent transcriptional regulator, partial [Flammeovirgaceae bacterium]|nr:sigma-54 dependent transcriptional regulator [Flammeovirgaceae bacterium]MDW8288294.1 sigma-54 dependent transcriptional regulator [Flammeovirgaceae bacterium]